MLKFAFFSTKSHSEGSSDPEVASSTMDALEQQKINMWQTFAVYMTPSIQRVVEFAKKVPGELCIFTLKQLNLK